MGFEFLTPAILFVGKSVMTTGKRKKKKSLLVTLFGMNIEN